MSPGRRPNAGKKTGRQSSAKATERLVLDPAERKAALLGVIGAAKRRLILSLFDTKGRPRQPQADVKNRETDPSQVRVAGVDQPVSTTRQGGRSTFSFSNLKENRNLSDKLFTFQIPRGVDVITNGVPAK